MIAFYGRSKLDLKTVCARLAAKFDLPEFYIQVEGAGKDAWDYVTEPWINITHVLDYTRPDPWKDWFDVAPDWNYKVWIGHPREQEMFDAWAELTEGEVLCD